MKTYKSTFTRFHEFLLIFPNKKFFTSFLEFLQIFWKIFFKIGTGFHSSFNDRCKITSYDGRWGIQNIFAVVKIRKSVNSKCNWSPYCQNSVSFCRNSTVFGIEAIYTDSVCVCIHIHIITHWRAWCSTVIIL